MPSVLPRAFTRLAWSNLAAQAAEQLGLAAAPIVAVLALGAGAGEIGTLAAVQTLPFLLLSIPLGVMADRLPRRAVMLGAEAIRAGSLLALVVLLVAGRLSLAALAVLGFIGAVGTVGFSVAAPALVPALVDSRMLARANGRLELARSAAYASGPALAGALVAWAGAPAAFVLASLLSATALACLSRVAEPPRPPASRRHPVAEIREGALFVWRHELLRPILQTAIAWNIAWFVLQAAYVPYAVHTLAMGAQAIGITLACYGAGMVVGALLASRLLAFMPLGRAIQFGPMVSVLASACMVATLAVPSPLLAGLSFFCFGVGPIIWTITSTTLRQSVTPGAMLGRCSSVFLTVNAGARPLGAALGGWVGASWGEATCLWLSLAAFLVQALIIMAPRVGGLRALPRGANHAMSLD